ncbi:MAG: A24 family peptidase, partial [Chloroflexota bacterium]
QRKALGLREPQKAEPDEIRARPHREMSALEWRHPLTEIMTAFFFVLAANAAGSIDGMNTVQYVLNFVYMTIFALIIVIDVEHKLILFIVMIPSIALGLADAVFVSPPNPVLGDALLGGAIGFGSFFSIYLMGFVFRWYMNNVRGRNINTTVFGYGDVVMLTFTGVLVGGLHTIVAIVITIMLGAAGAILFLLAQRFMKGDGGMTSAIPYGPYIVMATIIMHLYGPQTYNLMFG